MTSFFLKSSNLECVGEGATWKTLHTYYITTCNKEEHLNIDWTLISCFDISIIDYNIVLYSLIKMHFVKTNSLKN